MLKKDQWITAAVFVTVLVAGFFMIIEFTDLIGGRNRGFKTALPDNSETTSPLFIPELVDMTTDGSSFEITVDETQHEFFPGYTTMVKSYNNQGYLGKTIRLRRGSTFYPTITNNIDEVTTVHWHGLEITGENDGGMGSVARVNPGESKTYELAVNQHASTLWYHPHAKGFTASQVYEGLAGLIIIEDDAIKALDIPDDYGVNDLPIILQAKLFEEEGNLNYGNKSTRSNDGGGDNTLFNGLLNFEDEGGDNASTTEGFAIMTNGTLSPYVVVANDLVRLRLLNGSNHGIMDVSTNDGIDHYLIGTDGGLLERPLENRVSEIAAGQRLEVLLDLRDKKLGDEVDLIANDQVVLTIKVTEETSLKHELPETLVAIEPYETYTDQKATHSFVLGRNVINGKQMDMMRIDETFVKDQVYYFDVINTDDENHSFHIHNAQFLVVEINGDEVDDKTIGWLDTIYLQPGESMKLQVQFRFTGDYMYHCHILIHEEKGMMGTFRVTE